MWLKILGYILVFIRADIAMVVLYKAGTPWWITYTVIMAVCSGTLCITYYGLGKLLIWAEKKTWFQKFKKIGFVKKIIEKQKKPSPRQEKMVKWLIGKSPIFIFLLSCIPFVPYLPTAIIVVARIMNIKNGIYYLLAANAVRGLITVLTVYGILKAIF